MNVRPSIAGSWYSPDPTTLERALGEYLANVPESKLAPDSILALVVPHAGHRYSGAVAGHGYGALRGRTDGTVLILGPLHRGNGAPALTSHFDAYSTPLGEVAVDRAAAKQIGMALESRLGLGLLAVEEASEHCIEIQLPFLQMVLGSFDLIPIMFAAHNEEVVRSLAGSLHDVFGEELPLLIASSDLSHFYPQARAEQLDREMLDRIVRLDPTAVLRAEEAGVGFACGRAAIAACLWASLAAGANRAKLLCYATSGDVTGDLQSVVGYASVSIYHES